MSILERPNSTEALVAGERPPSDRLRVITAGQVGNMQARLGASGFDVVAVAETEDALIDAVSVDEPDAIVVEADFCDSLEHVRDLAPDAVLIVVGDHTPVGALGRIERGVSGTVMAGLLHALVAEGVGAAVPWGLIPAFGPGAAVQVPQSVVGSLLSAKADFVRAYLVNAVHALRDHAELVTAASAVAVTVSAGVLLTLSGPRTQERPARLPVPAPAVERAPQEPAQQHPFAVSPTTPTSAHGPSGTENEPGDRRGGRTAVIPRILVVTTVPDENEHDQGEDSDDQVVEEGSDDQVVEEDSNEQVVEEGEDPHGKSEDPHGKSEDPHGKSEDPHGKSEDPHGKSEDPHGKNEDDHGVNQDNDDQGENESEGDQAEESDDQGENEDDQGEDEGNDDQGVDENDQVVEEGNDDQGETTDPTAPL
jgi:hypothetical protein